MERGTGFGLSGERLDRYLVRVGHAASRRDAAELVARGVVRVNGHRAAKGAIIVVGDSVDVEASTHAALIEPEDSTLEVLFEDDSVIVVNKRGGIPCHPLRAGERGTVMNAVVARYPDAAIESDKPLEGGLVHRLDNGTSGALIIARSPESLAELRKAIRSGKVFRRYQALVVGNLSASMELDDLIAHHPKNPRRMIPMNDPKQRGRRAFTRIEPARRARDFTLVDVFPTTGVRHQIRVHLASAGFPIVGDLLYGGPAAGLPPERFWLHLEEIRFDSPVSREVTVIAPLPDELRLLVDTIGGDTENR